MSVDAEKIAELAVAELKHRIGSGPLTWAVNALESTIRSSIVSAVKVVVITAPGVVVEDARGGGGAVVEDRR